MAKLASLFVGTAAAGTIGTGMMAMPATAATAGLFGSAGSFGMGGLLTGLLPTAMPSMGTMLSGGASILSGVGSFGQADTAEELGRMQQELHNQTAQRRLDAARIESSELSSRVEGLLGKSRRAKGAVVGTGSNLLVSRDISAVGNMERQKILHGGEMDAWYEQSQGTVAKAKGRATASNLRGRGVGKILTGAGTLLG